MPPLQGGHFLLGTKDCVPSRELVLGYSHPTLPEPERMIKTAALRRERGRALTQAGAQWTFRNCMLRLGRGLRDLACFPPHTGAWGYLLTARCAG